MGKIIKELTVYGDKGSMKLPVLFDSGASVSLIRKDVAEKLLNDFITLSKTRHFKGVNGEIQIETNNVCVLSLDINEYNLDGKFYIAKKIGREIIIGVDFMQTWEIKLDPKNEALTVGVNPNEIEII